MQCPAKFRHTTERWNDANVQNLQKIVMMMVMVMVMVIMLIMIMIIMTTMMHIQFCMYGGMYSYFSIMIHGISSLHDRKIMTCT